MSDPDEAEIQFEGVVRAFRYDPGAQGKQFLGAMIECADGSEWVIDYDEQSPFHVFADHQVLVSGRPYTPEGQRIGGNRIIGHLRVSTMRVVEVTSEVEFVEVGPAQHLSGRFERSANETGEATLTFVSTNGDAFLVANDPAGAVTGRSVDVLAYAVEPSPSIRKSSAEYLWVICPHSAADLRKWRKRQSQK